MCLMGICDPRYFYECGKHLIMEALGGFEILLYGCS